MKNAFMRNKKISKYDFKFNSFTDEGIDALITLITESGVQDIELSNVMSEEVRADFTAALANNKPKKGKGGKGKKKKK